TLCAGPMSQPRRGGGAYRVYPGFSRSRFLPIRDFVPSTRIVILVAAALSTVLVAALRRRRRGVVRVGVDIIEVEAVAAALASPRAERYLSLIYGTAERRDCTTASGIEASRLAARFAAKEAVR